MIKLRITSKKVRESDVGSIIMSLNVGDMLCFLNVDGVDIVDLTDSILPDMTLEIGRKSTTNFRLSTGEEFKNISVIYGEIK